MRFAALALLLGLPCVGLPCVARAAEPDTYIFDVLALQPYKGNFARLTGGEGLPDWVHAIAVQGAGAAGPSRTVDVAGTPYRLDRVCKVGAPCAQDRIDVLWAPRGAKVWAALVQDGRPPVLLGEPKGAQAEALRQAVAGLPAPAAGAAARPEAPPPQPATPTSAAAAQASAASPALAPPATPAPRAAEVDPYIFDVLPLQPYKGNFARLVKGKGVPGWVRAISAQGAGSAGSARTVDVAGTAYRLDRVCKVGASCASDRVDVLWAPRGARVWAALVEGGATPVLLGEPKGAQAAALRAAADPAPGVTTAAAMPPHASGAGPSATPASPAPATPAPAAAGPVASAAPQAVPTPSASPAQPAQPAAEFDFYIFDVLPLQPYKGNFARLVKAKGLPGWVHAISAQGAGAAGPARTVEVAGTAYRLDRVCKVGAACATDRLDVLWAPRGARVWGALVADGKAPVMLGDPKDAQARALAEAAIGVAPK